jgi:hypothetical protein
MPSKTKRGIPGNLLNKIKSLDNFGMSIPLTIDEQQMTFQSYFGAFMTIVFVGSMVAYFGKQFYMMVTRDFTQFTTSTFINNSIKENVVDLNQYKDTFNMIVGVSDSEINIFENEYFSTKLYELDENYAPFPARNVTLKKCGYQEMIPFIKEKSHRYYPNSVCFDHHSETVGLLGNWF